MAWLRSTASWFDGRRRALALFSIGWVLLMVVASGNAADDDRWFSIPDGSGALAGVLLLSAMVGAIILLTVRPRMRESGRERQQKRGSLLTIVLTTAMLVAVAMELTQPQETEAEPDEPTAEELAGPEAVADAEPAPTTIGGRDIVALVALAVVAAAALAWSRGGAPADAPRADPPLEVEPVDPDISSALDSAARLLGETTDPRAAVLAAYAVLEDEFAASGRGRVPWETPSEHMTRALRAFPATAQPAAELGRLYEMARYSDASITEDDRRVAASALERAKRELSASRVDVR